VAKKEVQEKFEEEKITMAIFKRSRTWWTDFTQDGIRYRESLRTTNWQEALRREKDRIAEVASGRSLASHRLLAKWPFDKAADHYIESRRLDLAERSVAKEKELLNHPKRHFGSLPLVRLTPEMLREYRVKRKADGLSNATLNMVTGAILRVLKMAKRRHLFTEDIKRLPEEAHVGRALTSREQAALLSKAASEPEWRTLRCTILLALNTTMRSAELKHLRWADIDFLGRTLSVRRSKTAAGLRVIPLNEDALGTLVELRARAREIGSDSDEHYVFPACESGRIEPLKPQKTWRTTWRRLTREAGLLGLRFHDLRHTAITVLAESRASEQTVMAIAGHVSRQMLEHYSHIRMDAKRQAVDSLMTHPEEGDNSAGIATPYGTNHVTNQRAS
jgi:integrase